MSSSPKKGGCQKYCMSSTHGCFVNRQQFKLTRHEENGKHEVAAFAVLVYLKAWITVSQAVLPVDGAAPSIHTRKNICWDQQEAQAAFMVLL